MKYAIFTLCFFAMSVGNAQQIVLDNNFSDWENINLISDSNSDGFSNELLELQVYDQNDRLYIRLLLERELQLSDFDFTFRSVDLYIDSDNNPNTGLSIHNIGADLFFDLGERYFQVFNNNVQLWERNLNDIDFIFNPTTSGTEFEMSFNMDYSPLSSIELFNDNQIKLIFESSSGDLIPDEAMTYDIAQNQFAPTKVNLKKDNPDDIRLLSYNTLNEGLDDIDRIDHFERIITAINPDIITFNESDISVFFTNSLLNDWLGGSWQSYNSNGSRNITSSRYPIVEQFELSNRMQIALIDLPDAIYEKDLLTINLHAQCCENDRDRQIEADRFIAFIRDVKEGTFSSIAPDTPFVLSGDFNFVGDDNQLNTILNGDIQNSNEFGPDMHPDWDNTNIQNVPCINLRAPYSYTWVNQNSSFTPGKLDYIIISDSNLRATKSFTLETNLLDQQDRIDYNLQANDTAEASDHLPIIADLRLRSLTATSQNLNKNVTLYYNPENKSLEFKNIQQKSIMNIYDINGRTIQSTQIEGTGKIIMNNLHAGTYLIELNNYNQRLTKKIIVTH